MPRYTPRSRTFSMPELLDRFPGGNPPDGYVITYSAIDGYYYPKPTAKTLAFSTAPGVGPYSVTTEEVVLVPNHTGTYTVNLPIGPTAGTAIYVKDFAGVAATHNINIVTAANIDGASPYVISTNYGSVRLLYNGTTWSVLAKN